MLRNIGECYGIPLKQGERYGIRLNIKGFHVPLKACAYRKKGMMLLPRGIERYSVSPWRVCVELGQELI